MRQHPELHWILENPNLNLWYARTSSIKTLEHWRLISARIGEDRHVMTYCIAGGQSFNMVLSHRDKGDPALFGMEEDILGDMRKEFEGWDSQYVATSPCSLFLVNNLPYTQTCQSCYSKD